MSILSTRSCVFWNTLLPDFFGSNLVSLFHSPSDVREDIAKAKGEFIYLTDQDSLYVPLAAAGVSKLCSQIIKVHFYLITRESEEDMEVLLSELFRSVSRYGKGQYYEFVLMPFLLNGWCEEYEEVTGDEVTVIRECSTKELVWCFLDKEHFESLCKVK